jgi:hypothetical protein
MIYGWRGAKIGSYDIKNTTCQYCKNVETQRVTEFGKYVHILWIPLFPIGKTKVAECTHCLRTIEEKDFPNNLRSTIANTVNPLKRPIWHYLGLLIIGGFIAMSILFGGIAAAFGDNTPDPREDQLKSYVEQMTITPQSSDSTSTTIKAFFSDFVNEDLDISKNEYFTTVHGNKLMVLVRFPKLKKIKKSERTELIKYIEMILDLEENLKGIDRYIGIYGKYNLMVSKTPSGIKNSRLALETHLLEYFGPKPLPQNVE